MKDVQVVEHAQFVRDRKLYLFGARDLCGSHRSTSGPHLLMTPKRMHLKGVRFDFLYLNIYI